MDSVDALMLRIATAFDTVRYPGDGNLAGSSYGDEPAALEREFRGRTEWRALDARFLDQAPDGWSTPLSFFSADAYRFYLPAYLLADLRGELESCDPTSRLCTWVTPQAEGQRIAEAWGGGTMGELARREFAEFDCAQVSAIVSYLWWRLEQDEYSPEIEQALENYWIDREAECRDASRVVT